MSDPTDLELIRALVEGHLAEGERARLEERLAAEPALRELREEYELVHGLSAPLSVTDETSSLRFEDLDLGTERPLAPLLRFARAAAAVLLVAAGAYALQHDWSGDTVPAPTVRLTAISLATDSQPLAAPIDFPEGIEDHRSWFEGGIEWLDSLEEGRLLARFSGRPLLVFTEFPGCPLCIEMGRSTFTTNELRAAAKQVVPVKLDLTTMSEDEVAYYWARYPYFALQTVDGDELHPFPGAHDAESLLRHLEIGLDKATEIGPRTDWERVDASIVAYRSAVAAEREGRFAEAIAVFERIASADAGDAFIAAAQEGLRRVAHEAAAALTSALDLADEDRERVQESLRTAAERFEGTPYEADFAAVRKAFVDGGPLPVLTEAGQ